MEAPIGVVALFCHPGPTLSTPPRTKNQLSSEETNNYWAAFFIVSDALTLCREKLLLLETHANDPTSTSMYRAARLSIDTQLELMQTMRFRFNDSGAKITLPTTELIRSLATTSATVTGFASDPNRLAEVIEMTGQIFTQFQIVHEL